ncbi:MAG: Tim44 domain-containing protein [Betaproteobacteria bacterium]|nr:Tim44 domain-containing protein [Betaproteobacteria bacterium]
MVAALALGAAVLVVPAEAKRLGGGKSVGTQRDAVTQRQAAPPAASPQQAAPTAGAPAAAAAPATSGARRWLGPIAGIAAGLGLAALLSHFGLGEGFASMLLILLLVVGVVFVVRLFLRARQPARATGMAYAGPAPAAHGLHTPHGYETQPAPAFGAAERFGASPQAHLAPAVPEGFEVEPFLKHAKLNFTSMQQAFDRADFLALKTLTTPEMFLEVKRDLEERAGAGNQTEVLKLEAQIVEVVQEGEVAWASVRFSGLVRENPEDPASSFDEVWNLRKDLSAKEGWLLAGIQQLN